MNSLRYTVQQETFEGENFCEFCSFVAIRESFLHKFLWQESLAQHKQAICESFLHVNRIFHQFAKVFSLKSFPLYGILLLFTQNI